jgi:PAS domain S-box-containing protein
MMGPLQSSKGWGTTPIDANERRFRETFETAAVGIAHIRLDGRWLLVNRKLCAIVGYSREELLGMTFQELTHPDDLEADMANARALLAGAVESYTMEKRYYHKDGPVVWVNLTVSLSREGRGRPPYFIGFMEEIGARKRAEEALAATRERLSMAQRAARIGVWHWSLADGSGFWTPEFCELYGIDADTPPTYETWLAAVHPDDRARADRQAREFFEERRDCDLEFRIIHATLGVRTLAGVGSLTFDPEGRPVHWVGINIDITERKRVEMELRRREQEFQALAENSPDIISRLDLQFRHLYVNRSLERASGIRCSEFLGRTYWELGMPEDLCRRWDRMLEASIETRREVGFDFEYAGEAGRRHYHCRFVPEFGPDGGVASILSVCTDVTDRKLLQAELLTIAEREQRRIGQDLHDDVGQELTGVGLMADALAEALREGGSPEAALAAKIRARLEHIQGRVRALSRGLIPVEVDARGLMDALDELAGRCRALHGLDCTFECAEPVPVEDNRVATHLYRITQEAIANATKSGHARHVRVSLRREGGITTLEVRDDGVGMPEGSRRGDGMGLRIMQYRAGLIGGILEVGPIEDQGQVRGTRVTCSIGGDQWG